MTTPLLLKKHIRPETLLCAGVVLCLLTVLATLFFGSLVLPFSSIVLALLPPSKQALLPAASLDPEMIRTIIVDLRLPRIFLALCSGAGLAIAGTIFQGILRNPLADPFTLGVSSGAAFGAALAITLGLSGFAYGFGIPFFSFAGATAALGVVLILSRGTKGSSQTLVLAGVVVSAFLSALITLIKALNEDSVTGIIFWIMGSFQGRGWSDLLLFLPGFLIGGGISFFLPKQLDLLSLGDMDAKTLGLPAEKVRLILLFAASLITASCVAVAGIIGFIGLIVPHMCRLLFGASSRYLLPASALLGGALLTWSDAAARIVLSGGAELPVGVITALFGAPFFCFLLIRTKKNMRATFVANNFAQLSVAQTAHHNPILFKANVSVKNLSFTYKVNTTPALFDINFTLNPGTFTGLLGPNGSGKSTLLQIIAGLYAPNKGNITVNTHSLFTMPEQKRALWTAFLLQRQNYIPDLTAFSIALMGRYAHTSFFGNYTEEDIQATLQALKETNAIHLAKRKADTLSGGELQRIFLARSLAQETPVLLLDEPTAALDPACQLAVLEAIMQRNKQQQTTVFAAMHDLNLAALSCSHLIFLHNGKIIAKGSTEKVFTEEVLFAAYGTKVTIIPHPKNGLPQALPFFTKNEL